MVQGIESILDRLWSDFSAVNPQALRVRQLLTERGDRVVHEQVSLRTLRHPKLGAEPVARLLGPHGYVACDEGACRDTHVSWRRFEAGDPALPDVVVSELELEECSRGLRGMVDALVRQVLPDELPDDARVLGGCLWHPVLKDTYESLCRESEHAAWVAAFGFRAHQFTVSVNELASFDSLGALKAFLDEQGFALSDPGCAGNGWPDPESQRLSTEPALCTVRFADGTAEVPGGCYQFAYRPPSLADDMSEGSFTGPVDPLPGGPDRQPVI